MNREKFEAFMKDHVVLCRKHGYIISACGCCDSPWAIGECTEERIDNYIAHLWETSEFTTNSEEENK